MRFLLLAAVVLALASPAFADTLQEVTTHGMIVTVGDRHFEVTYTPDGKLTVNGGRATGSWRIDGDSLCTTFNGGPETCVAYPKGKTSGDTFEVPGAQGGSATVKIK
jgi:opacity protein-like surface antigen